MARFIAKIQGQRGSASRLGGISSGIVADVNGWQGGVRIEAHVTVTGEDEFYIYATSGSDGTGRRELVGVVKYNGTFCSYIGKGELGGIRP